ncbi:CCA tRNA nucleotidyltransferase [Candidatus Pelagibacter sp.]|uniref:CCA tRNA nucleotidyltransferase n=1 Tax=Candidatus Pelagibacter sp. TaxID=2024849 RepID=UPI003F86CE55
MESLIDKLFSRTSNLDYVSKKIKEISKEEEVVKIFNAINTFSSLSEVRFVGGCIRKVINKEEIDDIDLATNLTPTQACEALNKNNIKYYETGIEHGTITAVINDKSFEITTLRKDLITDGRHAEVEFSDDWKEDASRRDFSINAIYSDQEGNLFDPFNGRKDILEGNINFIGSVEKRIKEDYLRIVRYIRFFLNYSKKKHDPKTLKNIKINLDGISNLSSERLLNELKKILKSNGFKNVSRDKESLELLSLIFPQLIRINSFEKLNSISEEIYQKSDFIFLLSVMIINETDNVDYFLYKFNLSKKDQKRIKILDNFYKDKITKNTFKEKNLIKILYFQGRQAILDILNYKIITTKKIDPNLIELKRQFENKDLPTFPIDTKNLMQEYDLVEGKTLGKKLKQLEEFWVNNNFQISKEQVDVIIKA